MKFRISKNKRNELLNVYAEAWNKQHKLAESTHPEGLVSRRDFLSHGLAAGSFSILVPAIASTLSAPAWAQSADSCATVGDTTRVPALCFDASGGTLSIGQDIVVTKQDGGHLSDNKVNVFGLALEDASTPANTDNSFGIPMHAKSGFLAGLKAGTSPEARAHCDGLVMLVSSDNDTQNNMLSINYYIASSGTLGSVVPISGNKGTTSGGNSAAIGESIVPSFRPVRVGDANQATGLTDPGYLYRLFSNTNVSNIADPDARDRAARAMADQVAGAIQDFSFEKLGRYPASDLPGKVKDLAACSYVNARALPNKFDPSMVNPNNDPLIGAPGGAFNPTRPANTAVKNGSIGTGLLANTMTASKLILDGYSGAATVTIDGRDFHTIATRQNQYSAKFEEGLAAGMAIEAAHRKGKNLFLYFISDGAATANAGDAVEAYTPKDSEGAAMTGTTYSGTRPSGDDSDGGCITMLVYRASATRDVNSPLRNTGNRQVGYLDPATGKLDRKANLVSANVVAAAKAVFLNYLALHGEEGRFKQLVGQNPLGEQLDSYIWFKNIKNG